MSVIKSIELPGGHWEASRPIVKLEVEHATVVLEATLAAGLTTVTFEGVTYRWQADPLTGYGDLVEDQGKTDPEIESRFASHPVAGKQAHDIERMRTYFRALAYEVKLLVPAGRDQSKALTHLEDGSRDAVAGIARKS
jgi:hypothetical protein